MPDTDLPPIAKCHCGKIEMRLPQWPAVIVDCNCSLCRRYGVLWAYYDVEDVQGLPEHQDTHAYAWNGRHVDFYRCTTCGCVTHWAPRSAARSTIGINARLLPEHIVLAARLRHKDGAGSGQYLD